MDEFDNAWNNLPTGTWVTLKRATVVGGAFDSQYNFSCAIGYKDGWQTDDIGGVSPTDALLNASVHARHIGNLPPAPTVTETHPIDALWIDLLSRHRDAQYGEKRRDHAVFLRDLMARLEFEYPERVKWLKERYGGPNAILVNPLYVPLPITVRVPESLYGKAYHLEWDYQNSCWVRFDQVKEGKR